MGEIGEITETQFGYHIIKLEQRLGEKINTSHILFSLAPSKKDVLKTKSKLKDVGKLFSENQVDLCKFVSTFFELYRNLNINKNLK